MLVVCNTGKKRYCVGNLRHLCATWARKDTCVQYGQGGTLVFCNMGKTGHLCSASSANDLFIFNLKIQNKNNGSTETKSLEAKFLFQSLLYVGQNTLWEG